MTKMDDVPATRGDLEALATREDLKATREDLKATREDLKAQIALRLTRDDLEKVLVNYPTKDDLKSELQALEHRIEVTLTRTINAAYESFRSDFRVLDDQDKAISERGARQIGNVLAELDAHREDPKAHGRR